MSFQHVKDIDPTGRVDAGELDARLAAAINRIWLGLEVFQETKGLLRFFIGIQLRLFLSTHKSIRLLIGKLEADPRHIADAQSLVREQVEKVFVITLVLDNPDKWLRQYFRSGWKTEYDRYLVQKGERGGLASWKQFLDVDALRDLERMKLMPQPPTGEPELIVSPLEQEAVEFKFNNPTAELPAHLKHINLKRDFEFPTPGKARDRVQGVNSKRLLVRWYKEYQYLCGYSHGLLNKLQLQTVLDSRSWRKSPSSTLRRAKCWAGSECVG